MKLGRKKKQVFRGGIAEPSEVFLLDERLHCGSENGASFPQVSPQNRRLQLEQGNCFF